LTRRTHCSHPAICACSVSLYKGVGCCSKVCFSMECCSMVCCSTASVSPYHAACKAHIFTFVVHRRFCCEQTRGHASIGTARCSLDACQPTMQREQLRESRHPRFWRASHFSGCLWYLYCKNQPFLVRYGYCWCRKAIYDGLAYGVLSLQTRVSDWTEQPSHMCV